MGNEHLPTDMEEHEHEHTLSCSEKLSACLGIEEEDGTVIEIKKNQFDATATILYSNGVSMVHFVLGISMIFVKFPNVQKAIELEKEFGYTHP